MPNNKLMITGSNKELAEVIKLLGCEICEDKDPLDIKFVLRAIVLEEVLPIKNLIEPVVKKLKKDHFYWGVRGGSSLPVFKIDYDKEINGILIEFESLWGPPLKLLRYLSIKYPELEFNLKYCELSFGHEVIEFVFKQGDHSYVDYTKKSTELMFDFIEKNFDPDFNRWDYS